MRKHDGDCVLARWLNWHETDFSHNGEFYALVASLWVVRAVPVLYGAGIPFLAVRQVR